MTGKHAHTHTRGHARRLFEAAFAFVLMPMDVLMLGWNQPWPILTFLLATTAAAFLLSKTGTERQFKLMLIVFATCALVSAVNDAIKAYRVLHHPRPAA